MQISLVGGQIEVGTGAMEPATLTFLTIVAAVCCTSDASVMFPDAEPGSVLYRSSFYSPPMTTYLGAQSGTLPAVAPISVFTGDACSAADIVVPSNSVVVVTQGSPCSFETQYSNVLQSGAVAYISLTTVEVPSLNAYVNDPHSRHIPNDRLPIPYVYVQVTPEAQDAILSASPNTTVSVAPDHNVWVDVYGSWQYQLLLRWVPAMIFTMSGCMAALFLFQHMRIVVGATEPNARRRWRTLCRSIASRLSLPHFTLALEISTTFPLAIESAIGGFYSTGNLPGPVHNLFLTSLSGFGFVSTILSATFWNKCLDQIDIREAKSASVLTRIIRGDRLIYTVALCAIPLAFDIVVCIAYAMYFDLKYPLIDIANGAMFALLQLVVGMHFLYGAVSYRIEAKKIVEAVTTNNRDKKMNALLHRLSRYAILLGLSMITYVAGAAIIAGWPEFFFSPRGWMISWSLTNIGRACESLWHVLMFRPRSSPVQNPASVPTSPY
ncbi:PA domain-containing protein [Plasmodiophora brassicae]